MPRLVEFVMTDKGGIWVSVHALSLIIFVITDKLHNFSELRFLHLLNGDNPGYKNKMKQ